MIDVSNLKTPGWSRVVAELSSGAPDDRAFVDRMLRILGQISAARQAVLYVPASGPSGELEPRALAVWPPQSDAIPGDLAETGKLQHPKECQQAAYAALESGQSRAFSLDKSELYDPAGAASAGYVLAVALPAEQQPEQAEATAATGAQLPGVICLLVEGRSRQAVSSSLAMAELVAGYVHTHTLRRQARQLSSASRSLDLATRLIGAINQAEGFKGAAIQLVNDIAKALPADRVALGWAKGSSVQVRAISDTEHFDRRTIMVQRLAAAMDECLDQEQAVLHPSPAAGADVLLAQAITHSHKELAAGDVKLRITSIPLRDGDKVVGVLTVESRIVEPDATPAAQPAPGGPSKRGPGVAIDERVVELLQQTMDLVAPVLAVRRSDDRVLPLRAWDSTIKSGRWLVGPKHTVWKLAGLAVVLAMLFVTFYQTTYRVGAVAELRARDRRVISVPFDAVLKERAPGIEAGVTVKAGQVLATLDDTELQLQAAEVQAKLVQAEKALAQAMREQKTAEARKAEAQAEEARAQLDLLNSRIARARITSPIDGTIIAGDLRERIGGSVKLGDELFQIATLDDMLAVARVDERDIALISPGSPGQLATKALPAIRFPVKVVTVVPLAEPKDGKNIFEVRVRLEEAAPWMRPGMEGLIRLDAGERSLLSIGLRRVVDTVRLWLW